MEEWARKRGWEGKKRKMEGRERRKGGPKIGYLF